ncbi:MAG TPA: HEAT repeat domain-containing protein [Pyrinomonadaceae bacterium]|nr:HEAT repeat domain-containing protein [Pyrinomonadaceae bacterium]
MRNSILKLTTLLTMVACTTFHVAAQLQRPTIDDLENHLKKEMVGPEAVKVIKHHLSESAKSDPLSELVAWAKAGFPDLHDENGYWKTESLSLKLGVLRAIHYYFSALPPENRSERYLITLKELERDDYISYGLTSMAHLIVDEQVLEREVLRLLQHTDPVLREQGVVMGSALAEKNFSLFEHYVRILRSDDNARVRLSILSSIAGWRRKDVAFIALERLVNDPDMDVRDKGATALRIAADHRILSYEDLATILAPMLKTNDPFIRVSIARAAARLTTDGSLWIEGNKITDDLLDSFMRQVRLSERTHGVPLARELLTKLWVDWWTPLIPKYTKPYQVVH